MNSENYITIQGWMRTELDLKGNELIVYAIIYGFSQAENHKFTGSLQYLADWCGSTKNGIIKNLNSLIEKQLIKKEDEYVNGIKFVHYRSTKFTTPVNKVNHPGELSSPYNIADKKLNNIEDSISKDILGSQPGNFLGSIKTQQHSNKENKVDQFLGWYREYSNLPEIRAISDARKKNILRILDKYSEQDIRTVLNNFNTSDFLLGKVSDFKANLDWILNENNFIKTLEGKYNNHGSKSRSSIKEMDNAVSETYTEEELAEFERLDKEREANGLRTRF